MVPLARLLRLGSRELVAFTGAGGKSTLMLQLATEMAAGGKQTLVTTTTKMGRDQIAALPSTCEDPAGPTLTESLATHHLVGLVTGGDEHKVTGPIPAVIDELYRSLPLDYLLVEADGARGRSLKAPGPHEPVVPSRATTVVVMMGVDAVGETPAEVAHRPERAAVLTGRALDEHLTAEDCATVVTHPEGGLQGIPASARVVVALTRIAGEAGPTTAERLIGLIGSHPRIADVIVVPGAGAHPR